MRHKTTRPEHRLSKGRPWSILILLSIAALASSCAQLSEFEGGQSANSKIYSFGATASEKIADFERLVNSGDYEKALATYRGDRIILDRAPEGVLKKLAEGLNPSRAARMREAEARLRTAMSSSEWGPKKAAMSNALETLSEYNTTPLNRDPRYRVPEAALLSRIIYDSNGQLLEGARVAFAAFDLRQGNFFELYPVVIPDNQRDEMVMARLPDVEALLSSMPPEKMKALIGNVAPPLASEESRRRLGAVAMSALAKSRKWRPPLSLTQLLSLSEEMKTIPGFPSPPITVEILPVAEQGGLGFKLATTSSSIRILPPVPVNEVRKVISERVENNSSDAFLVVDLARLRHSIRIGEKKMEMGKVKVGSKQVPNPEWVQAQKELDEAQQEAARRTQDRQKSQNFLNSWVQMRGGGTGGTQLAQGLAMLREANRPLLDSLNNAEVSRAKSRLDLLPRYIKVDSLEDYPRMLSTRALELRGEIGTYHVNGRTKAVTCFVTPMFRRFEDQIYESFEADDPEAARLKSANDKAEGRIAVLSRTPLGVMVSHDSLKKNLMTKKCEIPLQRLEHAIRADRARFSEQAASLAKGVSPKP